MTEEVFFSLGLHLIESVHFVGFPISLSLLLN